MVQIVRTTTGKVRKKAERGKEQVEEKVEVESRRRSQSEEYRGGAEDAEKRTKK